MHKLVLMRHGESQWNLENRFTGWTDVDLTEKGRSEAKKAGELLKSEGFVFDMAFTSVLKRAIRTLWITLDTLDEMWIPVVRNWRLNERHYGALQGLNKSETAAKYGEQQVLIWRRAYAIAPNPLTKSNYDGGLEMILAMHLLLNRNFPQQSASRILWPVSFRIGRKQSSLLIASGKNGSSSQPTETLYGHSSSISIK